MTRLELDLDKPFNELTGGKRDGTVPARARRVEFGVDPAVACPASKSGKLSLPGDSGIVSRNGVECPLPVVGGPHICGECPSCACISRALRHNQSIETRADLACLPFWKQSTAILLRWRARSSTPRPCLTIAIAQAVAQRIPQA